MSLKKSIPDNRNVVRCGGLTQELDWCARGEQGGAVAGWSACWCLHLLGAALMKSHNVGGLSATGIYFSRLWWLGSPRSRDWQIWYLVRAGCLVHAFLPCPQWQKPGESSELSGVSFISTLIPSMEALPLRPVHLAEDQSPNG